MRGAGRPARDATRRQTDEKNSRKHRDRGRGAHLQRGDVRRSLVRRAARRRRAGDRPCPARSRGAHGSPHLLVEGTSFAAEMRELFDRGETPCAWWRADGWPLLALSAEARWRSYDAHGLNRVIGGVLVGSRIVFPRDAPRILPLQPIWSGFVINSVLYTSLWFLLFSLGAIRSGLQRHRRRRQQRCVHCGYKLVPDQTRCSECGEDR